MTFLDFLADVVWPVLKLLFFAVVIVVLVYGAYRFYCHGDDLMVILRLLWPWRLMAIIGACFLFIIWLVFPEVEEDI